MSPHLHKFKLECKSSNNHVHRMSGYTDNMIGISSLHVHRFFGISSYYGHTHYYAGMTGLPVKTENGHIHRIEGTLEFNDMHEHRFSDFTFEDVEYIPKKVIREAYV